MSRSLRIVAIVSAFFLSSAAFAGPFGIESGTSVSKLSVVKQVADNLYEVTVPNPNSNFENYFVTATPQDGVCKIAATGKTFDADAEGVMVRAVFTNLQSALTDKYGKAQTYDFLHANSIWKENTEFAMSLRQNQRTLASIWTNKKSSLPDDLQGIMLEALGLSASATYVRLNYEFNNIGKCMSAATQKDKSAL